MLCKKMITSVSGNSLPCGQCLPCMVNRKRKLVTRLLLEQSTVKQTWFVTLTYAEPFLPLTSESVPTLKKSDYQNFLKRLRKSLFQSHGRNVNLKYFCVGEYGELRGRPHWHFLFFDDDGVINPKVIEQAWTLEGVLLGKTDCQLAFDPQALNGYVAGYVTKKMEAKSKARADGSAMEFARWSKGLAARAAPFLAKWANTASGVSERILNCHPREIRLAGRKWPLDRYMLQKIDGESGHEFKFPVYRKGVPVVDADYPGASNQARSAVWIRERERRLRAAVLVPEMSAVQKEEIRKSKARAALAKAERLHREQKSRRIL